MPEKFRQLNGWSRIMSALGTGVFSYSTVCVFIIIISHGLSSRWRPKPVSPSSISCFSPVLSRSVPADLLHMNAATQHGIKTTGRRWWSRCHYHYAAIFCSCVGVVFPRHSVSASGSASVWSLWSADSHWARWTSAGKLPRRTIRWPSRVCTAVVVNGPGLLGENTVSTLLLVFFVF